LPQNWVANDQIIQVPDILANLNKEYAVKLNASDEAGKQLNRTFTLKFLD
jgi:hypothetical protein